MTTKAEQALTDQRRLNSEGKRVGAFVPVSRSVKLKHDTELSPRGRALHGRTKLQADAKAGKPIEPMDVLPNGGEATTSNGVSGTGRGADGVPSARPSRKSTRGAVPGGEKPSNMTRAVQRKLVAPEARAARAGAARRGTH